MEKIVDKLAEAGDKISFKEEFAKAQKKILEKLPTPEHFRNLIEQLKDLTEEEKEKLIKNIADRSNNAKDFKDIFTKNKSFASTYQDYFVFIGMVFLVVAVFGEISLCYQFVLSTKEVNPHL